MDKPIKALRCECGSDTFNVETGALPWYMHELECQKCGQKYRMPRVFVTQNGIVVRKSDSYV